MGDLYLVSAARPRRRVHRARRPAPARRARPHGGHAPVRATRSPTSPCCSAPWPPTSFVREPCGFVIEHRVSRFPTRAMAMTETRLRAATEPTPTTAARRPPPAAPDAADCAGLLGTGDHRTIGRLWVGTSLRLPARRRRRRRRWSAPSGSTRRRRRRPRPARHFAAGCSPCTASPAVFLFAAAAAHRASPRRRAAAGRAHRPSPSPGRGRGLLDWLLSSAASSLVSLRSSTAGRSAATPTASTSSSLSSRRACSSSLLLATVCVVTTVLALRTAGHDPRAGSRCSRGRCSSPADLAAQPPGARSASSCSLYVDHRYGAARCSAERPALRRLRWAFDAAAGLRFAIPALGFVGDVVPVVRRDPATPPRRAARGDRRFAGAVGSARGRSSGRHDPPSSPSKRSTSPSRSPAAAAAGVHRRRRPTRCAAGRSVRLASPLLFALSALLMLLAGAAAGAVRAVEPLELARHDRRLVGRPLRARRDRRSRPSAPSTTGGPKLLGRPAAAKASAGSPPSCCSLGVDPAVAARRRSAASSTSPRARCYAERATTASSAQRRVVRRRRARPRSACCVFVAQPRRCPWPGVAPRATSTTRGTGTRSSGPRAPRTTVAVTSPTSAARAAPRRRRRSRWPSRTARHRSSAPRRRRRRPGPGCCSSAPRSRAAAIAHGVRRPARLYAERGASAVHRRRRDVAPEGRHHPLTPANVGFDHAAYVVVIMQWARVRDRQRRPSAHVPRPRLTVLLGVGLHQRDRLLLHADGLHGQRPAGVGVLVYAITGLHLAMAGAGMVFIGAHGVPHARRPVLRPRPRRRRRRRHVLVRHRRRLRGDLVHDLRHEVGAR